jgi:N-acyl-D-aspartate/D-glutamate deacylase
MLSLSRNEAVPLKTMQAGMPWDWETFPEYLSSLNRTPKGVNILPYIGMAPIYAYVMGGFDAAKERYATEAELETMCRILVAAIEAGACGFSTQMQGDESNIQRDYDGTPMVTDTRPLHELQAFARAMGSTGRGVCQLSGGRRDDIREACEIVARESGRPVLFNILTPVPGNVDQHGTPIPGMEAMMEMINSLNAQGLRVYGQAFTHRDSDKFYTLEDYNFFDGSDIWRAATLGGAAERLPRLTDPQQRAALRAEFDAGLGGGRVQAIPKIQVHWVPDEAPPELKRFEGQLIADVARQQGKHPVDAFLDLACSTNLRTEFKDLTFQTDLNRVRKLVNYKYSLPGVSDGGAHTKYDTFGCYTTQFLVDWVREHEMIDLEEAHWRLSAYPAFVAGITDRGFIREGAPADLVVYDFENLGLLPTKRTYDFPAGEWRLTKKATGYRYTIVNGKVTFIDSEATDSLPGCLLSHARTYGDD